MLLRTRCQFGTYCMCLILELFMYSFPNIYNYSTCNIFLIYNVVKLTSYVFTHYLFSIIIFAFSIIFIIEQNLT